jgi:REP-associated tyrosine transposase
MRLKEYDYCIDGTYFVTICTKNREALFGKIVDGEMYMNHYGEIILACWKELPEHFPTTILDEFVIMPNHVHGIIIIIDYLNTAVGAIHELPLRPTSPAGVPFNLMFFSKS